MVCRFSSRVAAMTPSLRKAVLVMAAFFVFPLLVGFVMLLSPVLFLVGRGASTPQSSDYRMAILIGGAVGTVLIASITIQDVIWALTTGPPADGEPGWGALLGAILGLGLLGLLELGLRRNWLSWMPVDGLYDKGYEFSKTVQSQVGQLIREDESSSRAQRKRFRSARPKVQVLASPPPNPPVIIQPYNWKIAEEQMASYLRSVGWKDAVVTGSGSDGGVDIMAEGIVAQVKLHKAKTGSPDIQKIYGVAAAKGVKPVFFSASGYSRNARKFADENAIPCFTYDPVTYEARPDNTAASSMLAEQGRGSAGRKWPRSWSPFARRSVDPNGTSRRID